GSADAAVFVNWSSYLANGTHTSFKGGAVTITTANAATLSPAWTWHPDTPPGGAPSPKLLASPTVFLGRIYIGSNAGDFYSVYDTTGAKRWKLSTSPLQNITCSSSWPVGFVSTASVAQDPGGTGLTAYVAAADGYLYAIHTSNGSVLWR